MSISSREVELRYVQSKNMQLLEKNEENLHVLIWKDILEEISLRIVGDT